MPFYDNEILTRNINDLMRNNGMTQVQLAEILGMSQPNVSKALSSNGKKFFTLDQVAGIAQHFKVSVDSLLGIKQEALNPMNQTDLARTIATLIANEEANYKKITVKEIAFLRTDGPRKCQPFTQENEYVSIYFPLWRDVYKEHTGIVDGRTRAEIDWAHDHSNWTSNLHLNKFFENFVQILEIHRSRGLDQESFNNIVESLLKVLDSQTPIKSSFASFVPGSDEQ